MYTRSNSRYGIYDGGNRRNTCRQIKSFGSAKPKQQQVPIEYRKHSSGRSEYKNYRYQWKIGGNCTQSSYKQHDIYRRKTDTGRSEERRVGKEWRSRREAD